MFAQVTVIRAPMNQMADLREMIETRYLPVVRQRPGFRAGYLLEQVDDLDNAQLIVFWDDQASVESFARTGSLQASISALTAELPGVEVRRQSYLVKLATKAQRALELVGG
ncbi:MAG: hypothetical protein JNJ61_16210 [Anaerolineae bacterium]|nr:hypothetical protein [Anaerolineae bacterium]